jgi:hypothetical protein
MLSKTVVDQVGPVTKDEFHAALCMGLSRAAQSLGGIGHLANKLDMTTQGLGKVFSGSLPCIKRLFDALEHDEHLLDDVAALYRRKIIPKVREDNRAAPALAAALKKVIDAECDGSIDHQELLAMEAELRDADKRINSMLHRIAEIKKPRVVA